MLRLIILFSVFLSQVLLAAESNSYKKSTEGEEVVRNKLFPKKHRVELDLPNAGLVLNQSYIDTYMVGGGLSYFMTETWGVGADFSYALNQDRSERKCIETFYNNFQNKVSEPECSSQHPLSDSELAASNANYGPAYIPIRQLNYLMTLNAIWNPVYGKQIMFLSATNYFDLFVTLGAGLAFSTYYPLATELKNGVKARGKETDKPGTFDPALYGDSGRPAAENQTNFLIDVGVGQKYHFLKRFFVKVEVRNYTLLGTAQGFDNFLVLSGGAGVRF